MDPVHVLRTPEHVFVAVAAFFWYNFDTRVLKNGLGLGARGRSDRGADAVFQLSLATCTCGAVLGQVSFARPTVPEAARTVPWVEGLQMN